MSQQETDLLWTVRRLLSWCATYFAEKGIDSPKTTAEYLLADTLQCKRMDLFFRYEQPLMPTELTEFKQRIKRRIKHEPIQYILGEWEFWSVPIRVDSRVLIPRPETELLIEQILHLADTQKISEDGSFLDLCTGSGAIACVLAKEFPEACITATDLSVQALEVAQQNAHHLGLSSRIQWHQGDLFAPLSEQQFSAILSNPPYISTTDMQTLQPEVRLYEPPLALDGGDTGLDLIERILRDIHKHLLPGGWLLMEFGASQGSTVRQLAQQTEYFQSIEILKDYARRDRILVAQRHIG